MTSSRDVKFRSLSRANERLACEATGAIAGVQALAASLASKKPGRLSVAAQGQTKSECVTIQGHFRRAERTPCRIATIEEETTEVKNIDTKME